MKKTIDRAKSVLLKFRQNKARVEVKIIEADNNYTPTFANGVASRIWNIIRIAILPIFSAFILCFIGFLCFQLRFSLQSSFVLSVVGGLAIFSMAVSSLMCNFVRGELRFCRERFEARQVGFYSFSEASTFLINAARGKPDVAKALELANRHEPLRHIASDLALFYVVPTVMYSCAFFALVSHGMSLGMVATLAGLVSLFVALVDDKISSRQNLAYFVMAAYKFR